MSSTNTTALLHAPEITAQAKAGTLDTQNALPPRTTKPGLTFMPLTPCRPGPHRYRAEDCVVKSRSF